MIADGDSVGTIPPGGFTPAAGRGIMEPNNKREERNDCGKAGCDCVL